MYIHAHTHPPCLSLGARQTTRLDRLLHNTITALQDEDKAAPAMHVVRQLSRAQPSLVSVCCVYDVLRRYMYTYTYPIVCSRISGICVCERERESEREIQSVCAFASTAGTCAAVACDCVYVVCVITYMYTYIYVYLCIFVYVYLYIACESVCVVFGSWHERSRLL